MEIKGDEYVLLHSEKGRNFHIEKLRVMLSSMQRAFVSSSKNDYRPLAIAETIDELQLIKDKLIKERAKFSETGSNS
ncbi:hypothetical protein BK025_09210 [Sodalis sp. TME1]|nr:hypothetical protein BK025_09210 [Sodalis sp. TME1]